MLSKSSVVQEIHRMHFWESGDVGACANKGTAFAASVSLQKTTCCLRLPGFRTVRPAKKCSDYNEIKWNCSKVIVPLSFFGVSVHPRSCCISSCREKKFVTAFPGPTQSHSSFHFPPLATCLNRLISAILKAISRLGAWWLLRTEQRRKTALKLSNVSVERINAGPNRRMSSIMCKRIWHFAFDTILFASTIARQSRNTSIALLSST